MNIENLSTSPFATRKRKRTEPISSKLSGSEICKDNPNGRLNLAFSSTPKKCINYEKEANFQTMEIKSIAELANTKNDDGNIAEIPQNPYEVLRKPPKKKKKSEMNDEAKCFVNPALNLDAPDTKFNPFEVKRLSPIQDPKESNPNCFINTALNIKAKDIGLNPFEVTRAKTVLHNSSDGLENPALELPKPLTIGLPFKPTLGCRIDFQNIPLENLTPTKLFAEKLVFSPANPRVALLKNSDNKNFRKSLSIISEELDIGKELDCYQIELENSINEAKLRKKSTASKKTRKSILNDINESGTGGNLETNLCLLNNAIEQKIPIVHEDKLKTKPNKKLFNESDVSVEINIKTKEEIIDDKIEICKTIKIKSQSSTKDVIIDSAEAKSDDDNDENCYKDDSFDDIDFKAPAPFVRAYRKPKTQNDVHNEFNENDKHIKNTLTSVIRKSVRKLMPKDNNKDVQQENHDKESYSQKIFASIRHSLRRNPNKDLKVENENEKITKHEISVIDCTERKLYKCNENNFIETEGFNNERKRSLRSSFRQSKNHLFKSVFKKETEEYKLRL